MSILSSGILITVASILIGSVFGWPVGLGVLIILGLIVQVQS